MRRQNGVDDCPRRPLPPSHLTSAWPASSETAVLPPQPGRRCSSPTWCCFCTGVQSPRCWGWPPTGLPGTLNPASPSAMGWFSVRLPLWVVLPGQWQASLLTTEAKVPSECLAYCGHISGYPVLISIKDITLNVKKNLAFLAPF